MAFLQLGGEGGGRPTYFEVYAADKLVPSLKAALIYSLSVAGQTHSWVLRLLQYEDEVFAAVSLLLERHSLATLHATFAESLYGLKRQPVMQQQQRQQQPGRASSNAAALAAAGVQQQPDVPATLLSKQQQRSALLCQVLLPYIKSKLDSLYARHSQQQQRGILGLALSRSQQQQQAQDSSSSSGPDSSSSCLQQRLRNIAARLRQLGLSAFVLAYPYIHASVEAVKFVYQLGYLLDVFDTHSPVLQLLGQRLVRLSGPEMAHMEQAKQQQRQQQLARARQHSSRPLSLLHRLWLQGGSLLTDHLRNMLILSVFGFKILEWWYTAGEDKLAAGSALPPPPPPPAPTPHPQGVKLPADASLCPLCRQQRVNPTTLAVSGYVFCYPCLFRHVTAQHCCPVTRAPTSLDHMRKLYDAM